MIKKVAHILVLIILCMSSAQAKLIIDQTGENFFGIKGDALVGILADEHQIFPAYYYMYAGKYTQPEQTYAQGDKLQFFDPKGLEIMMVTLKQYTKPGSIIWGIFISSIIAGLTLTGIETYTNVSTGKKQIGESSMNYLFKIIFVMFMATYVVGGMGRFMIKICDNITGITMTPNLEFSIATKERAEHYMSIYGIHILDSHARLVNVAEQLKNYLNSIDDDVFKEAWDEDLKSDKPSEAKKDAIKIIDSWINTTTRFYQNVEGLFTKTTEAIHNHEGQYIASGNIWALDNHSTTRWVTDTVGLTHEYVKFEDFTLDILTQSKISHWIDKYRDADENVPISYVIAVVNHAIEHKAMITLKNRFAVILRQSPNIRPNFKEYPMPPGLKFRPLGYPDLASQKLKVIKIGTATTNPKNLGLQQAVKDLEIEDSIINDATNLANTIKAAVVMGGVIQATTTWALPLAVMVILILISMPEVIQPPGLYGKLFSVCAVIAITSILIVAYISGAISIGAEALDTYHGITIAEANSNILSGKGNVASNIKSAFGNGNVVQIIQLLIITAPITAAGLIKGGNALAQQSSQVATSTAQKGAVGSTIEKLKSTPKIINNMYDNM